MSNTNEDYMLTTYDNPYNPFTDFETWFKTDVLLGHNSCQLLNEIANVNSIQDNYYNEKDVEDAIDYIISKFPMIYRKVTKNEICTPPGEDKNKKVEGGS